MEIGETVAILCTFKLKVSICTAVRTAMRLANKTRQKAVYVYLSACTSACGRNIKPWLACESVD